MNNSRFIVVEGLDGSGKSTAVRLLADQLNARTPETVKTGYEPFDAACAGDFIRTTLRKEIQGVNPFTLALSFAANRLDHCDRWINPWLEKPGRLYISDRGYLSSLVYQHTDDLSMERILDLNEKARKPDIIFFFNVDNETCYERMKKRNQPQELFEQDLESSRKKYQQAIDFLRDKRDEKIVEINANGTPESTVKQILEALSL